MTGDGTPLRLLYVEDHPPDVELVREILSREWPSGARVDGAPSLAQGLARLAAGAYDAVLLDLHLPDSDGLETIRRTCAAAGTTPVVALSGLAREQVSLGSVEAGTQDFLGKDQILTPGALARAIRFALDRARMTAEIRRQSAELERANRRLRELDRSRDGFVSMVSHELKHPLAAIVGYASLLREAKNLTRSQREDLDQVLARGADLLAMIEALLDLSRIRQGGLDLLLSRFELADAVPDALFSVRQAAEDKGLTLAQDLDGNLPPLYSDRPKLVQVLTNLLANACKHTDRGRITVRARPVQEGETSEGAVPPRQPEGGTSGGAVPPRPPWGNRWLAVEVQDTGRGIAPEERERIFEEFHQAGPQAARRGGIGLGLAIARGLAQFLGGTLTAASEVGVGSVFTLSLPARHPSAAEGKGYSENWTSE